EFFQKKMIALYLKDHKLLKDLVKFQMEFNKTNIVNSYLYLCEIFVYLCEEKKYLDVKLCESIYDFKNKFQESYSSYSVLGFKKASVKNKEALSEELLGIIKKVSKRCIEA
ncbi:hypothetical protein IJ531_07025, partial [bacterium]|nr:hypothetical protein [bacterium]